MKQISISDIVFLLVAGTVCYLAIIGKLSSEQFLNIASMVFAAYYVHKAQNKLPIQTEPKTSSTTTTTSTNKVVEPTNSQDKM